MLGRPIFDFVVPENREQARVAVREKMQGTRPLCPIERPYITRDGRRIIVAIEERYRLDDHGRIVGIRSTLQDITERKRTEAALVASERRSRCLRGDHESMRSWSMTCGWPGPRRQPPAACRRLGYSRDELLAMTTNDIDLPEFAASFGDRLRRQVERGHLSFEVRHRTKDGRIIPVDVNSATIVFEDRRAVLSVIRGISERKALEEAQPPDRGEPGRTRTMRSRRKTAS